ncbi:MAG: ribokinase, partial [Clostridiales bacterium]
MKKIVVIGSINVDLVTQVDRRPKSGETLMGTKFQIVNGGKGANQAIAASRLASDVSFIGCVGNDVNGEFALENLLKNNIKIAGVTKLNGVETGIANIVLSEGDNSIIVVPGANFCITKEHIHQYMKLLLQADMVILQLEILMDIIEYVVDICYKNDIKTILNPAPATDLSMELINKVSYLTPNEHEFELMFKTKDLEK